MNAQEDGLKRKVAIGKFSNKSRYARGIFYNSNNDPVGKHAMQLLSVKLSQDNRFILLKCEDIFVLEKKLEESRKIFHCIDADYLIIGSIMKMDYREIGPGGTMPLSTEQVAEACISLKLVDVSTGLVVFTGEASGFSNNYTKTVNGLGTKINFDNTLEDKAISVALDSLVGNVVQKCLELPWKAYILGSSDGRLIISGGKSQGVKIGEEYKVMVKGKKVMDPQSGMYMEFPAKRVAKIRITDLINNGSLEKEASMAKLIEGKLDPNDLSNYYITEK